MVRHRSGECYAVPTVWQVNNVYFPRKQWHWFIGAEHTQHHHNLVHEYFQLCGLDSHLDIYLQAISPHYQNHFKSRLITLAIRMMLIYKHNPNHFGHNPLFVAMKVLGYWNNILWSRITQCNNFGYELEQVPNGFHLTKKQTVAFADKLLDALEPTIDGLYPRYVARLGRISKW
jgi:hypothetical protein